MKKRLFYITAALLVAMLVTLLAVGVINNSSDAQAAVDDAILPCDEKTVKISSSVIAYDNIEQPYNMCDYFVLCEVTSVGQSYLLNNHTFDPESDEPVSKQLRTLRTPYSIEVLEVFKGDSLAVGDVLTVVVSGGTYAGYTVETSFPEIAVGGIYIMPLKYIDTDENAVMINAMAEITDDSVAAASAASADDSDGSAEITASMFDSTWEGIDTLDDLRGEITAIKDSE